MSTATEEIIRTCEALPSEKCLEPGGFARFLPSQGEDARWEELLAQPGRRPRLDEFLHASAAEGNESLFDLLLACKRTAQTAS